MSKGRFAAVFQPKKPAAAVEPESDGSVESKPRPARKPKSAPARALHPRSSAKTKPGRQRIPVIRWVAADSLVTVGAKVPAEVAQHWAIEAKRQRTSISYLINQALIGAFGVPEGAILPEEESG
jgi:hypothetical protein